MAANFSSAEDICEGENCQSITHVTYNVKVKKKLCEDCASKEGCIEKAGKGGSNLYCVVHAEVIKLYCKTHGIALCDSCAIIDHQQSCERQDIGHTIMDKKAKLNILKEKAKDKLMLCRVNGDQIRQCMIDTDTHLQALKGEVDSVINEAIQTDKDIESEDAAEINQEIDEKNQKLKEMIRMNDEEREKLLERNRTTAEKRREPIHHKQSGLHTDIQNIAETKNKKIDELGETCRDNTKTTGNRIHTLETVLEDDQNVVNDRHHVETSVSDELKKPLNEGEVKQITDTISGVRFVKGAGKEYDGRIDWYDGEWKLSNTINIKEKFESPYIVGCIDEYNVIIKDKELDSRQTYMLDLHTKHTQTFITGSDTSDVDSCILLNDDKVVCGNSCWSCTGESLTGCISVYDRQWKHVNDITIPRYLTDDKACTDVAVDQDGMIIAAEWGQSNIYVINPADGKIMNTITCKENIKMRGVLSSGNIIAQPFPQDHRVLIIDRQGAQKEITHNDFIFNVCIDPMTDDLYVVASKYDELKTCVIDQVMSGSDMKKRRVASFPLSTRLDSQRKFMVINYRQNHLWSSRVMMTSSGNMIACDGFNFLVFKKLLSL